VRGEKAPICWRTPNAGARQEGSSYTNKKLTDLSDLHFPISYEQASYTAASNISRKEAYFVIAENALFSLLFVRTPKKKLKRHKA